MRALGNARETAVGDTFDDAGYCVIALRASGSRGTHLRSRKHPVCGDLVAIPFDREANLPWFQIECGGVSKRASAALAELRTGLLPGFTPLVVLFRSRRRRYYLEGSTRGHATLAEILDQLHPIPERKNP